MTNQNSNCPNCGRKWGTIAITANNTCPVCGRDLIERNSPHPTTSKSEEITFMCPSCDMRYVYKNGSTECPNCEPISPTRLENWEEKLESGFNKNFGFGIWDSRAKNGHRSEGIPSTAVLEWTKSFISTLLQEERNKMSDKLEKIMEIDLPEDIRLAVYDEICNLQQSNEK